MTIDISNIDLKKYNLSDDSIKAVKELVNVTLENLLRNISLEDIVIKKYQTRLDEYMMKQYPDLSNRLNSMALSLQDTINKLEKREKEIATRMKSIAKSDSLYEDVYNLRDEVKVLKEVNEELMKKLKKAFS